MNSQDISYYVLRVLGGKGKTFGEKDKEDEDERAVHRLEFNVRRELNQRGHPAFVPCEEKLTRNPRTRRLEPRKHPLFPCYVFAGFRDQYDYLATRDAINKRAEDMGRRPPIIGAIGFGDRPAVVTPSDLDLIARLSVERPTEEGLQGINIGDTVMVLDGPYRDRVGKLSKADRKRIIVMLEIFTTMLPVEMSPTTSVRAA